ncbi:MAG: CRTAC1 family protein [Planctomycetes bacterium]|nr:CRTAC1 family protein [Planctomycetota bacterium]
MKVSTVLFNRVIARYCVVAGLLFINTFSLAAANAPISFTDVTKETGITFTHKNGASGGFYIIESISAGLALFDYDNDGDIDIYFLNGAALKGAKYDTPPKNELYRNDGNFKFTNVTEKSGLGDAGFGVGVAVADYDNDGDLDVYVENCGPNVLFSNNGDGTFTNVTKKAGVGDGDTIGAGACFLDIDKDGDLDLYASRYIVFSYDKNVVMIKRGYPAFTDPTVYVIEPDALYRNNSDGTFTDISDASGISKVRGTSMGVTCVDYDNDGDTDIFVANDNMANFLFQNDGTGKFEEVGLMAGVAYDFNGKAQGSMGVDIADYDNDGLLDFYVTSYELQPATLYKNLGDGLFEDVTFPSGASEGTFTSMTWGTGFADFDNDGDRDIFVVTGNLQPNIEKYSNRKFHTRNELLMNTGDGKFVNITDKAGDGMAVELSSRGAGFDDLDNDGDIDVVILNTMREPTILRNDSINDNSWIQIRLKGVKSNRNGIGSRVKVTAGELVQIEEVRSGRGYQGHHGLRLYFGLAKHKKIDKIEVRWLGGGVDVLKDVKTNQLITITEGQNSEK